MRQEVGYKDYHLKITVAYSGSSSSSSSDDEEEETRPKVEADRRLSIRKYTVFKDRVIKQNAF